VPACCADAISMARTASDSRRCVSHCGLCGDACSCCGRSSLTGAGLPIHIGGRCLRLAGRGVTGAFTAAAQPDRLAPWMQSAAAWAAPAGAMAAAEACLDPSITARRRRFTRNRVYVVFSIDQNTDGDQGGGAIMTIPSPWWTSAMR
jgi:hypothetical protein